MNLRLIRPEDRRRSGGNGAGPGSRADWADTVPAFFRSEAFAEDLAPSTPTAVVSRHDARLAAPRESRDRCAWMPQFGLGLAAVLGLRRAAPD